MTDNLREIYIKSMCEITAYLGPMFSRKTSTGLSSLYIRKNLGDKTAYITHSNDTRYEILNANGESTITTHDGSITTDKIDKIIKTNKLMDINPEELKDFTICIDEAQFFDDLPEFIEYARYNLNILYICSLISTYDMKKFGKVSDILHLCSDIKYFKSYCILCNMKGITKPASFSARFDENIDDLIDIGGIDKYYPTCIDHHPY